MGPTETALCRKLTALGLDPTIWGVVVNVTITLARRFDESGEPSDARELRAWLGQLPEPPASTSTGGIDEFLTA